MKDWVKEANAVAEMHAVVAFPTEGAARNAFYEGLAKSCHNLALTVRKYEHVRANEVVVKPTDEERAREIVLRNPLVCGPCGGPLPNPECPHRQNGLWPVCIPASDSTLEAEIVAEIGKARRDEYVRMNHVVGQRLGEVLGYPRYCDDRKNFPDAKAADGVCIGEHDAETIAMEAADRIRQLEAKLSWKVWRWKVRAAVRLVTYGFWPVHAWSYANELVDPYYWEDYAPTDAILEDASNA